jgi:hypothetical protein
MCTECLTDCKANSGTLEEPVNNLARRVVRVMYEDRQTHAVVILLCEMTTWLHRRPSCANSLVRYLPTLR